MLLRYKRSRKFRTFFLQFKHFYQKTLKLFSKESFKNHKTLK